MVRSVVADGNGRTVFSTIDAIKEVHATCQDLLDTFLQLKRRVRGWILSVEQLGERLATFDTRVNGRMSLTALSSEPPNGSATTEVS